MAFEQIGRYKILELLGQGGMGQVYRAHDPELDREVVIKLVTLSDPANDQTWYQRFKREVQAAARLNHPHIVTVYDVGMEHTPPYLVMEPLNGGTLQKRLKGRTLPWPEALLLLRPLAEALAYAHQAGIIHRDIKPGNVMFTAEIEDAFSPAGQDDGTEATPDILKLVDFGLARWQTGETVSQPITQAGMIFGTPAYMSPEQARGESVDARTDIFPLGIMLFEIITGRNPLKADSLAVMLAATVSSTPLDLTPLVDKAPPEVIHLIQRAIAKNRDERYPTCRALLTDLDHCLSNTGLEAGSLSLTHMASPSPLPRKTSTGPMSLQIAPGIQLTPPVELVIRTMFNNASRVAVEAEFGSGLSGGRVLRVKPHRERRAELPAVVKIAPTGLILTEWQAYQTWVSNTLPGIARLESPPILPPGSSWAGLRYTLFGGGSHEIRSLQTYYYQATPADIRWILTERLYAMIGINWWLDHHLDRSFQMQANYDSVLPVNLLVKLDEPPPSPDQTSASAADRRRITPEQPLTGPLSSGAKVELHGFVVTEVDINKAQIVLDLPSSASGAIAAYRLRLIEVPQPEDYTVGQIIGSLTGTVTTTRHDLLVAAAAQALGPVVDLSTGQLPWPPDQSQESSPQSPGTLPNPLLAYQDILSAFRTANISTVHGDLNLENILVDPDTRHINLIDFATVREGHALHDLLRLETEVLTKLVPQALAEANLPLDILQALHQQVYLTTLRPDQSATFERLPAALEKPFVMLAAIRKMARACLFNPEDWTEYYHGLILYLLGALKFKNLDTLPAAPLPKQVAFWSAALTLDLLRHPLPDPGPVWSQPAPPPPQPEPQPEAQPKRRSPVLAIALVTIVVLGLAAFFFLRSDPSDPPPAVPIARVLGAPKQPVQIQRAGTQTQFVPDNCDELYYGDRISIAPAASISLACETMMIHQAGQVDVEVSCEQDDWSSEPTVIPQTFDLEQLCPPSVKEQILASITRSNKNIPRLIPRNTAIRDPRPTFSWEPVEGATGYRLLVELADGNSWQHETMETQLAYPEDELPLLPGNNFIILTTLDDPTAVDKPFLTLLTEAEEAELSQAEIAIQNLNLDEAIEGYMLYQLYRQQGLSAAALDQLEQQLAPPAPPSADLAQQAGDLYLDIGLPAQAEVKYQLALEAAIQLANQSAQANAHVGLARTAHLFEETSTMLEHLEQAENLYRQAGDLELAEKVAQERVKQQK